MNISHIEAAFWEEEEAAPNSRISYRARRAANGMSLRVMPMSLNSRSESLFSSTHVSRYFRQLAKELTSFIVVILCPAVVRLTTVAFRCFEYRGIQSICAVQYSHRRHSVYA